MRFLVGALLGLVSVVVAAQEHQTEATDVASNSADSVAKTEIASSVLTETTDQTPKTITLYLTPEQKFRLMEVVPVTSEKSLDETLEADIPVAVESILEAAERADTQPSPSELTTAESSEAGSSRASASSEIAGSSH